MAFETDLAYRRLKPDEQERHLNGLDDESIPQHNVSVDDQHNVKRSMTSMQRPTRCDMPPKMLGSSKRCTARRTNE